MSYSVFSVTCTKTASTDTNIQQGIKWYMPNGKEGVGLTWQEGEIGWMWKREMEAASSSTSCGVSASGVSFCLLNSSGACLGRHR